MCESGVLHDICFGEVVLVLVSVLEKFFKSFEYAYEHEYEYDKAETLCFMQQL